MIPLIGYAPDRDPTAPGVLTDCAAYVPSFKGMKSAPSPVTGTLAAALAAECIGSSVLRRLDNTTRLFAGTATAIYEGSATSWTDRTRAVGGAYTGGVDTRWRFAQFGNVSLATNKADTMQFSSSGAFADISGGIKAAIIETAGDYIIAADTNDGTYGDSPNRWWVTPDYANWTPAIADLIATGIITSTSGPIRAVRRFGKNVVLYKERSMFLGQFVGPPTIFQVDQIPGDIGAASQECIANIGTPEDPRHIFMGFEDFYSFDGARPVPIGNDIKETVFGELNKNVLYKCMCLHDRIKSLVYFYYVSNASVATIDKCVVYNYRTGRWGRDDRTVEAVVEYIGAGLTYDDLGTFYATYGTTIPFSYDSPFWTAGYPSPAIFNSSHILQTLTGMSGSGYLTIGDVGDEVNYTFLRRAQLRFLTKPTSATMTNYYRNELGDALTTDQTVSISNGRFDVMRSARWHRCKFDTVGNSEIPALRLDLQPDGLE